MMCHTIAVGQGECAKNLILGNRKSRNPLRSDFYCYGNVELWVREFEHESQASGEKRDAEM